MNREKGKRILFFILMLIITFPFLQHCFPFFESEPLKGEVVLAPDTVFTVNGWWDSRYQKEKTRYLNDNAGGRSDLVRLNNQIDYWLFGKLHANGALLGKDEHLFERIYIDEYNGIDFKGDSVIRDMVMKLKKVQDTLEHLGKTFVFICAPSKAWYFPDKFPNAFVRARNEHNTNYKAFTRLADSAGMNLIDFNAWFMAMKGTGRNTLFSRAGTHWSVYGSLLATDSIIKYIEHAKNIKMPELKWDKVEYSDTPRKTDNDIAVGVNLITQFKRERLCYPRIYYENTSQTTKPKAIYIGDSFLWTLSGNRFMQNVNADWQLWYYFDVVWTDATLSGRETAKQLMETGWQTELLNTDYIVMMYTPANFKDLNEPWLFIAQAYKYFYPGK